MSTFERADFYTGLYMEHLRNQGAVRYPEDPLVETFRMRDNVYSMLSKSPGMGGDAWMHLIIGPERALLIDTGFGIGNLKALVERLTDKPYDVVNTHFHGDHTLGNFQFDRVYCHEYDADALKEAMKGENRSRFMPPEKKYYEDSDVIPVRDYEVVGVKDGHIFDLGDGYEVELIHLPGHAPGGCGFIDRTRRILFSGDALVSTPCLICGRQPEGKYAKYMTVQAYYEQLQKLMTKIDDFDCLFPGHAILGYTKKAVPDMLTACREVLKDPKSFLEIDPERGNAKLKDVGAAAFAYTDNRVYY